MLPRTPMMASLVWGLALPTFAADVPPDDLSLIERIRDRILEEQGDNHADTLENYTLAIPKTGVELTMVAIPGGRYLQGSLAGEPDRRKDEGPQREVEIAPFWMGKHEVTWDEFEPFMITPTARRRDGSPYHITDPDALEDIVSAPTTPYTEMSFGMGVKGFPAICMTQHAALKYCQWLSAQTGHFYRLPTEAEWEYACRAGTTTAFSWGDDASLIDDYAWYWDNADDKYQKVGQKKPNPWGLHDMHGNVMEWTLDRYLPDAYEGEAKVVLPWVKRGDDQYPRVTRGGSWYDDVEELRSAARVSSHPDWKIYDPQKPRSVWYMTEVAWLGFRLVRDPEVPSAEIMEAIWNQGKGSELGVDPFAIAAEKAKRN